MINCIIVDDEEYAIEIVEDYIKSTTLKLSASFTNPLHALSFLKENDIDLVFLDVQMPELTGMEFIELIDKKITTIITTGHVDFAKASYDHNAIDFLLKPISLKRFLQAVTKVENTIRPKKSVSTQKNEVDYFMVKTETKGKMIKINFEEIDYIEGMQNYIAFHHNGIQTLALFTMKEMEERLPQKSFSRIHKSFIISTNRIASIEGNFVLLKGISKQILIGDIYKRDFINKMTQKLVVQRK